jgi:ribosomal protein L12E/L44/L45/RPP1/RPP2
VTLLIAPGQEWLPGRQESRARVVAAGLTDEDIDRLIKQAQHEVAQRPE